MSQRTAKDTILKQSFFNFWTVPEHLADRQLILFRLVTLMTIFINVIVQKTDKLNNNKHIFTINLSGKFSKAAHVFHGLTSSVTAAAGRRRFLCLR